MPKEKGALNADPVPPAESDDKQTTSDPSPEKEQGDKPATLLDAVRNAVPDKEESAAEETPASETSDPEAGKEEAETETVTLEKKEDGEPAKEDTEPAEDPRLDKHPRFQQLLAEVKEVRAELARIREIGGNLNLPVDTIGQLANQQMALDGYMRENNITPDDLDRAIGFAQQIKNDPVTGLKKLEEYAATLRTELGLTIDPELQERVESGYLDEETARELSERRAQERLQKARNEQLRAAQEQQTRSSQQAAHISSMQSAATLWENSIVTRDPDYDRKKPLIYDRARTLIAESPPADAAGVNAIMDQAHKEVTVHLNKISPKKPVTTHISNGLSSGSAKPQPKTLREAVHNA